jgi:hypothetical protein
MQTVTRYKAKDGSEWALESDCLARDNMVDSVANAMSNLKNTPKDCSWKGYVQQSSSSISRCKEMLFRIANKEGVLKWWIDSQINGHGKTEWELINNIHPSWFGRMLDGGCGPLSDAYHRLCCIDTNCREWNQPYYAMNPGGGEMVCVG